MASAYDHEEEEPIDDGEGSMSTEGEAELLQDWAASAIQRQWRHHSTRFKAGESVHVSRGNAGGDVCCACFAPIDETGDDALAPEQPATQLFCGSCKAKLRRGISIGPVSGGASSPVSHSVASPLPKLSLLVQTEAKYQDQLRLLRQQQDLLRQQQHELEQRKKLQADTHALEKQLAKQRRREFKQLVARRQAEEARRLLEIASAIPPPSKSRAEPMAISRPRSVTAAGAATRLEPTQLGRGRIPAPPSRAVETDAAASKAAELAERAAQEHRRKQKLETLKCYAQDLTPLVHGNKPKKLPLPTPTTTTQHHHSHGTTRKPPKKTPPTAAARKPSKIVHLTPLSQPPGNNQQEQTPVSPAPALRVAIPRQSYETYAMGSVASKAAPTPLTAEIKPASWMYELLTSDPVLSSLASDTGTSVRPLESFALTSSHSQTQLTTLHEELDDGAMDHPAASAGQRVTLAPLPSVSSSSATYAPTTPALAEAAPVATYSSERLASLLQKYNVTVARPTALG